MLQKILNKIESKRKSRNVPWLCLVLLKDVFWIFLKVVRSIFPFVFFGSKIKHIKRYSFRYWLGKKYQKYIMLFDYDDIYSLYIPLASLEYYSQAPRGEYIALKGYFSKYLPKKGDVVIDAGTYHGLDTIIFSLLVGDTGKVISFEPASQIFKRMKKNVDYHKLKNVILINKGLYSNNKEADFCECNMGSSFFIDKPNQVKYKAVMVRLDDELSRLGIKEVNFIKMDIEGAEIEAIKGAGKTLKNNYPNLAIASYHVVDGEPTHVRLEKILREYGYKTEVGYNNRKVISSWLCHDVHIGKVWKP